MVLTIRPPAPGIGDPGATVTRVTVRRVAVPLMAARGYDAVTVDDIVAAAGISRRTFFRLFNSKQHVLSCDHEVYVEEVRRHLAAHESEPTLARSARAMSLVLESLTAVRDDAEQRERLLGEHPALPSIENQWFTAYEMEIADHLTHDSLPHPAIETAMLAGAVVAAVKATIQAWLRDPSVEPITTFTEAVSRLQVVSPGGSIRRTIALFETSLTVDELRDRIERDDRK